MFAGETRLMNDDAPCTSTDGPNGTWPGTEPMSANALATYVTADSAMITGSQAQCALPSACQLLPAFSTCGSRK